MNPMTCEGSFFFLINKIQTAFRFVRGGLNKPGWPLTHYVANDECHYSDPPSSISQVWNYRHVCPMSSFIRSWDQPRSSCMQGKHSANGVTSSAPKVVFPKGMCRFKAGRT